MNDEDETAATARRHRAVEEAEAVLSAIGGEAHLDGFNLLGVIANPRGSIMSPSSFHGRYNPSTPLASSTNAAAVGDALTDTYYSFESTLSSVSEQISSLNAVLEDWSRSILEDPVVDDQPLESVLEELPRELQNLDLQTLQSYLEASGVKAHAFTERRKTNEEHQRPMSNGSERSSRSAPLRPEDDIPSRFFDADFDLTDGATFGELLLLDGEAVADPSLTTSGPVHEWFPLPPPDSFGGHLDKVELDLLQQVRSQSDNFFQESLRFAQLQEWIHTLQQQVVDLQGSMKMVQHDLLEPMETIPQADGQRAELQQLLQVIEATTDVLRCKASIAGYLSADDDLAAIDQIQYGRQLLWGAESGIELRRLQALKTVGDQLNQYEQLVVTNLREELVEIFLGWNTSAVSSIYAVNGSSPSRQKVHERVGEIFGALEKCQATVATRAAYSQRLQDVIRMTVRTTVGEFATDGDSTVSSGASSMSLERFLDCLDMLFEQLLALLTSASGVDEFCREGSLVFKDDDENETEASKSGKAASDTASVDTSSTTKLTPMAFVVAGAAELSSKSVSELLRLRKDAHSLVTLDEMKRIWDRCMSFVSRVEELSGHKVSALRSTLLAQAKSFVERKHESNMSSLVAALDSERWTPCLVSAERQVSITRLCTGRSVLSGSAPSDEALGTEKRPAVEVEGRQYKVVWSCLLLIEMTLANIAAAAQFPSLASNSVAKVTELLRLFNARTTQLVLGAGAIHSTARLKSINAKHLSMVTQCLGMVLATLPHIRAGLMAQLPAKQHTLLSSFDQIKKEFTDHNEKVLNKFVTIIGSIVEHGLAPKIPGTDFDARAKIPTTADCKIACCIFLEGVSSNTRKMHQVLASLLPPDHLEDVFSRIFAFVDQKVPALFIAAADQAAKPGAPPPFSFPKTEEGKQRFLAEIEMLTSNLNGLEGVQPWDFSAGGILARQIDYEINPAASLDETEVNGDVHSPKSESTSIETNDTGLTTATLVDESQAEREIDDQEKVTDKGLWNGETVDEANGEHTVEATESREDKSISAQQDASTPESAPPATAEAEDATYPAEATTL